MNKKLSSEKQISIATFLGGPLTAGFLISKNYFALENKRLAYITLASTFLFSFGFFYSLIRLPEKVVNAIPDILFPILFGLIALAYYKNFMAYEVNNAISNGSTKISNWTVAGFTLAGILLSLIIVLCISAFQPFYDGKLIEINDNELYYDDFFINEEDAELLAKNLESTGYFSSENQLIVKLDYWNKTFIVTFLVEKESMIDPIILDDFKSLKSQLSAEYNKAVKIKLETINISGEVEFIYIE